MRLIIGSSAAGFIAARIGALIVAWLVGIVLPHPFLCAGDSRSGPPSDTVSDQDQRFWSIQKSTRPAVPKVNALPRVGTPVDAFILARLEVKGLGLAPEADRRTLCRRVYLDLVGLPPSPEDVEAFAHDTSPDAYERLVDRLLASPQFGERWGRHWLDVAGYVDTVGFDVDADNIITSEGKWLYRDYVIRAFNDDKPYDRFLQRTTRRRRAGRLAARDRNSRRRSASCWSPRAFCGLRADFTHEDVGNIPQNHFGILHDTLEIVGSSLLGLTLNCARCHNHKFDPVPQEDYYRLMAVFTPAYNPQNWKIVFPYDKKLEDRFAARRIACRPG